MEYVKVTASPVERERNLFNLESLKITTVSSDFRRELPARTLIPLTTMSSETREFKGIMVKSHLSGLKVPRHLLWHLLFKGCSVTEWFLLYDFLSRNEGGDRASCACLAGVLCLSSATRKSARSFDSQLRPIHKILRSHTPRKERESLGESLLDFVTKILKVPQKGLSRNRVYTQMETHVRVPRPPEPQYVGVGYKDKGSLGGDNVIDVAPEEILSDSYNVEDHSSLSDWKKILSLYQTTS